MTIATYHNFDLLLTRSGARYKASVADALAGEVRSCQETTFRSCPRFAEKERQLIL
jgi:hypothetical protein